MIVLDAPFGSGDKREVRVVGLSLVDEPLSFIPSHRRNGSALNSSSAVFVADKHCVNIEMGHRGNGNAVIR